MQATLVFQFSVCSINEVGMAQLRQYMSCYSLLSETSNHNNYSTNIIRGSISLSIPRPFETMKLVL